MKTILSKIYTLILRISYKISPKIGEQIKFFKNKRAKINFYNPQTFTEKLALINLYDKDRRHLKGQCADKLLVRQYIKEKKMDNLLNDIYGVYLNVNEIEYNLLPNKFVLKCTYGSGYNVVIKDKSNINKNKINKTLMKGLKNKINNYRGELHYNPETNVIISEKYIESIENDLIDYKVYCFNGVPKVILVMSGRQDGVIKKNFYDFNWDPKDEYLNGEPTYFDKPNHLDEMYEYSKKLSKDFLFVRVDFYDTPEKLIFGELTFTPAGNYSQTHSKLAENHFGSWLDISELKKHLLII